MRISDWSSDVCSSDLHRRIIPSYDDGQVPGAGRCGNGRPLAIPVGSPFSIANWPLTTTKRMPVENSVGWVKSARGAKVAGSKATMSAKRSEEHTSELQSLMRISYAVFCLRKQNELLTTDRASNYEY